MEQPAGWGAPNKRQRDLLPAASLQADLSLTNIAHGGEMKKQRCEDAAEYFPAPLTHEHFELVLQVCPTHTCPLPRTKRGGKEVQG